MLFYPKPNPTMAPSHSKIATKNGNDSKPTKEALLPLVPTKEDEDLPSGSSVQFLLRSDPADADSPKYKVACRVLQGDEDVRTMIRWCLDTDRVLNGLNVTTYGPRIQMVETMMRGTPLTIFQVSLTHFQQVEMDRRIAAAATDIARNQIRTAGINHQDNKLAADVPRAVRHMLSKIMPRKVLPRVKRYLRRECRKPADMKVRNYMQHILRINLEEIPMLPPFDPNQGLSGDEGKPQSQARGAAVRRAAHGYKSE